MKRIVVLVLLLCVIDPALMFGDSSARMVSVHEALGLYGFEGGGIQSFSKPK